MNIQEEFEKLLEAEWEGRLDARGQMRLDVLCQEHPDFLKTLEDERKITRLLQNIGPNDPPVDLAKDVLRRISGESTPETAGTSKVEPAPDSHTGPGTKTTTSRRKFIPYVQWGAAAALLAFIFFHGASIIHREDRKREVTENGSEDLIRIPLVPFHAIPVDGNHSMSHAENPPDNMRLQESGAITASSFPDTEMKSHDRKQQKHGARVVAKLTNNPRAEGDTGAFESSTPNHQAGQFPMTLGQEDDSLIADHTEKIFDRTNLAMAGDPASGDRGEKKHDPEIQTLEFSEADLGLTIYVFGYPEASTLKMNPKIPDRSKNPGMYGNASGDKGPGKRTFPPWINTLSDRKPSTGILPKDTQSKKQGQPISLDGQDGVSPLQNIRDLARRYSGEIESMERIYLDGGQVWRLDLSITYLNLTNLLIQLEPGGNPPATGVPSEDRKSSAGEQPPLRSYARHMYGYAMKDGLSTDPFPDSGSSGSMLTTSREALDLSDRYQAGKKLKVRFFVLAY